MNEFTTNPRADLEAARSEHEFNVGPDVKSLAESSGADSRRFPRLNYRTCVSAVVHPAPGEAGELPDVVARFQMLTRDISRGGLNLLHKQQLFPGQKIDLVLTDGQERRVEVIWCRRLGVGCYSAGCRFVKADPSK